MECGSHNWHETEPYMSLTSARRDSVREGVGKVISY